MTKFYEICENLISAGGKKWVTRGEGRGDARFILNCDATRLVGSYAQYLIRHSSDDGQNVKPACLRDCPNNIRGADAIRPVYYLRDTMEALCG